MTSPDSPSLSRGTPEKACDCEGLWNDPATSMGPVARESYNRTRHLPNCPSSKFNEWYARPALSEGEATPTIAELRGEVIAARHALLGRRIEGDLMPEGGCSICTVLLKDNVPRKFYDDLFADWQRIRIAANGEFGHQQAGIQELQNRLRDTLAELDASRAPSLSTSSPELTEMLDELQGKIRGDGAHVFGTPNRVDNRAAIAAARSAIELSFATLTEEIKRLKLWIPDCDVCGYPFDEHDRKNGYCFHGGIGEDATSYEAKPSEEIAHAIRTLRSENERLRQWNFDAAVNANAEIASLRATALTPEEAKCLYCLASLAGTDFEKAAREKLLFISPITDRALGPEEAAALVLWIESARGTLGWKHITIEKRAIEKLRLISARSLSGETPK